MYWRLIIISKLHNGGKWTEAKFHSFVKSALRGASRRWPPKYETLNASLVGVRTNIRTGRKAKHFTCARCAGEFVACDVQVDHIKPIIDPEVGFTSWDDVVNKMFCEKENLQVLCKDCHKKKTAEERLLAKQTKEKK